MERSCGMNCQLPGQSIELFHQMTLLGSLAAIWQHRDETLPIWGGIKHMNPLHGFCLFAALLDSSSPRKEYLKPMQKTRGFCPFLLPVAIRVENCISLFAALSMLIASAPCTEKLCWAAFCRNKVINSNSTSHCWNCACCAQPPS